MVVVLGEPVEVVDERDTTGRADGQRGALPVGRHDEDPLRSRELFSPAPELRHPSLILEQRRRTVAEVQGGESARRRLGRVRLVHPVMVVACASSVHCGAPRPGRAALTALRCDGRGAQLCVSHRRSKTPAWAILLDAYGQRASVILVAMAICVVEGGGVRRPVRWGWGPCVALRSRWTIEPLAGRRSRQQGQAHAVPVAATWQIRRGHGCRTS